MGTLKVVREGAEAMLHPVRQELLQLLREPASAATLAGRIGLPRQKLNYHLHELESAGLVRVVDERRKGNVVERRYQAVADAFVIDPRVLGEVAPTPANRPESGRPDYLVALGARLIEEVALLKDAPTLAIETEVAPLDRAAFARDLTEAITRVVADHHHPDEAQAFRLVLALHPTQGPSKP